MLWVRTALMACVLVCLGLPARGDEPVVIRGGGCAVTVSPADGSIAAAGVVRSGEYGLWRLVFEDGSTLEARRFQAGSGPRRLTLQRGAANRVDLEYDAPEATVGVRIEGHAEGVDFSATVQPRGKVLLSVDLPARLRFDTAGLVRVVSPLTPHAGVGAGFLPAFFREQPSKAPSAWRSEPSGPAAYTRMAGGGLEMRPMDAAAEPIAVTAEGRKWLGSELSRRLDGARLDVARPSRRAQVDLVLLDSPAGPVLAASRLGGRGNGAFWRWGGFVRAAEIPAATTAWTAIVAKLATAPGSRRKAAVVRLTNGPDRASGCDIPVASWPELLGLVLRKAGVELVELTSPEALRAALERDDHLLILNPYGECIPVSPRMPLADVVDAIKNYVRRGGQWVETGGYSFYLALRPVQFLEYEALYPPLFADFVHVERTSSSLAVYRVQPRNWAPWQGASDPAALFVPGRAGVGGDPQGGWYDRSFATYVKSGAAWTTPVVRLAAGRTPQQGLDDYARANGLQKTLADKMTPGLLDRFRNAVLVRYSGTAREMIEGLHRLPVPSLIHFAEYLQGGFDKQYPDHLPPRASYGTPEELRRLFDESHALGHLVMPYTNPTWWCDHPRGPTFVRAGEAPLAIGLDGKPYHEKYAANDGWTTTPWHPSVQAANRTLREQFTRDYPVDILFQDQCGARTWVYDRNPASPVPFAYAEGLLSQVDEDARVRPLSTEDGYDRVLNGESQLCGFTFALVPGRNPEWARAFKSQYPPGTWEIAPVVQWMAHDKAALLHHDLGKFVDDRPTLAWTLGLGFAMSAQVYSPALAAPRVREWLRWLDRVQKSICARYVGAPVRSFRHEPGRGGRDDGLIRAQYGPVKIVANLGPDPRTVDGRVLSGFGFVAEASGMLAGSLQQVGGRDLGSGGATFVADGGDVWILARPGAEVGAILPGNRAGRTTLMLDGQEPRDVDVREGATLFTLPKAPPAAAGTTASATATYLWHATLR